MTIKFGDEDKKTEKNIKHRFQFPSIQGIGWIPYFGELKDLPQGNGYAAYAQNRSHIIKAFNVLFKSGNKPDPSDDKLKTYMDLDEFLKTRNYRAALVLRNIELYCFDDGTYEVYGDYLPKGKVVGFTPIRSILPFFYWKGVCGKENLPSRTYELDGVEISYQITVQICLLGNLFSKFFTGYYAPFVKLRVTYYLKNDGTCLIGLTGSVIPSQKWHVFNYGTRSHDMLNNTKDEITDFLEIKGFRTISQTNYPSIKIAIP